MPSKVGIVFASTFSQLVCKSPKYENRYHLIMGLIHAYNLTEKLLRIPPAELSNESENELLTTFHSLDYINALRLLDFYYKDNDDPNIPDDVMSSLEEYGLAYDCQGFPGVFDYAIGAVRGTVAAVDCLINEQCQVAINWAGGWHHARRSEAAGFCYLNDVVIGLHRMLHLTQKNNASERKLVMYIDLDLHHGDGVEEAFAHSPRLLTFSVHHSSPGFFPGTGTGSSTFTGAGHGRYSAFNLPLDEGVDDSAWHSAVQQILTALHARLGDRCAAIVVQCGADGLTSDPHHVFNLTVNSTHSGYVLALRQILNWHLPTLLLGGGGYHFADTARLWTLLTSIAINSTSPSSTAEIELPQDIPNHENLVSFGPSYTLDVETTTSSVLWNYTSKTKHGREAAHQQVDRLLEQLDDFCTVNNLTTSEQH